MFDKFAHHSVKFDEKHYGDVSVPVRVAVVQLCQNFAHKCGPEQPKMELAQF